MTSFRHTSSTSQSKKSKESFDRRTNVITLLKADHRQGEEWFKESEGARSPDRKQELATQICGALRIHTTIEEEIFYPAFINAAQ